MTTQYMYICPVNVEVIETMEIDAGFGFTSIHTVCMFELEFVWADRRRHRRQSLSWRL